jgi:hypothetical protein
MNDFLERLLNEKEELDERSIKLAAFLGSDKIDTIDPVQKALLSIQLMAMYTYKQCLVERLARL